jgi:hypothetical protein
MRNFSMRVASRVLFFAYTSCLATLTVIAGPISAHAASLGNATLICEAGFSETSPVSATATAGGHCNELQPTILPQSVTLPTVSIGPITASAFASVSNGPPSVNVSASATENAPANYDVEADASLYYYATVLFIGASGTPLATAPINVSGSITVSPIGLGILNTQEVTANGSGSASITDLTQVGGFSNTLSQPGSVPLFQSTLGSGCMVNAGLPTCYYGLHVGDTYQIALSATVEIAISCLFAGSSDCGSTYGATITVDPVLSLDCSQITDCSDYQLVFSQGIDNSDDQSTSATPLPATLPLFAGGLSALGLLGWRRKRRRKPSPSEQTNRQW